MNSNKKYTNSNNNTTDNNNETLVLYIDENLNDNIIEIITESLKTNTTITTIKILNICFQLQEDKYDYDNNMNYQPEIRETLSVKYKELKQLYQKYINSLFDAISHNDNITSIDISNVLHSSIKYDIKFDNYEEIIPKIIDLIKNNHIKKLNLSNNNLTEIKDIFNVLDTNTSLEEINLSHNKIKEIDYIFNTLQINKSIKKIDLSYNLIISIKDLDKIIDNNRTLEEINLSANKIADTIPKNDIFYVSASNGDILHSYFNLIQYNHDNDIIDKIDKSIEKNPVIRIIDLSFNDIYNTNISRINEKKILVYGTPGLMNNYL